MNLSSNRETLDLLSTKFPVAKIEILNGQGVLVQIVAPSEQGWGGDEFSFTALP